MEFGVISVPKAILYELSYDNGNTSVYTFAADEVLSGWAVGILERKGQYLKVVTHYGYEGLLDKEVLIHSSKQEIKLRNENKDCYVITTGRVDLMSIPSVRGEIYVTLYAGSYVFIKETIVENGYCKVWTVDGKNGYLPLISITKRNDSDEFLYSDKPEDYFLNQHIPDELSEDTFRTKVTECAKQYLGTQYRWSGKTVDGIDCSGLTFMSYLLCGMLIYRDAKIMDHYPVKEILISRIKKGDLLFFPGHVAMYLGDHQYIHATGYEKNFSCVINSLLPSDENYREDLAEKLTAVGSIF